jgi:hypothetical protein
MASSKADSTFQRQVERLVASKLGNFEVPAGFTGVISPEFLFAFCYPQQWRFTKLPQFSIYGVAQDTPNSKGFSRNCTVTIGRIPDENFNINDFFDYVIKGVLYSAQNGVVVSQEDFLFLNCPARKLRVDFTAPSSIGTLQGVTITSYSIHVVDLKGKKYLGIGFTCSKEDFDSSRELFDTIANTFRI